MTLPPRISKKLLPELLLVVQIGNHGGADRLIVALAHHERGAGAFIERQYSRVFRVGFHERLNAPESLILVAEHGVGATLGASDLRFKFFQVIFGVPRSLVLAFCGAASAGRLRARNGINVRMMFLNIG